MKTNFTCSEMSELEGCYAEQQVDQLYAGRESITLIEVLNSQIPLEDKVWFLLNRCELSLQQKQRLSYELAVIVAPLYNEKYPNDNRINDCIDAIKLYNEGKITKQELESFAHAAYAHAAYASAAYSASYAAYAAYTAAASASAVFASAAAAKDDIKYTKKILNKIKEFVKNNS